MACGCTNPRSTKDTFMLGESGQILAEFNPKGMIVRLRSGFMLGEILKMVIRLN